MPRRRWTSSRSTSRPRCRCTPTTSASTADRPKKMAIKDYLETGQKGVRVGHLLAACVDEFSENEDLPNTTNPDDWAHISGKKGERIVFIRTLISSKQGTQPGRSIDTVSNTGQYL